jgi:stage III sporulation protein AF
MIAKLCGYLLTIVATAMILAIVQSIITIPKLKRVVLLAGGAVLLLTVLSPLVKLDLKEFTFSADSLFPETASEMNGMQEKNTQNVDTVIKQETEAYILDKADTLGAVIAVEVTVEENEEGIRCPYSATVTGMVSGAQKDTLSRYMSDELGIPAERQVWKTI